MTRHIEIVEVGPRDGLQNEARALSVADRVAFITKLEAAGVRRIETVSFVNDRRVPQMAHAEEVMAALPAPAKGVRRIGLVLNARGWERCVGAGCDEANVVICASEGFGVRNQGSTPEQQLDFLAEVMERNRTEGPPVSATVSVAFGCPFDGEIPEGRLTAIVRRIADMGVREIALADTIGVADPWTVRRRVEAARAVAPRAKLRLHFHDTRRTGLANAYAGVEAGVDVLDASAGGFGGPRLHAEPRRLRDGARPRRPHRRRPLHRRKAGQGPAFSPQPRRRVSKAGLGRLTLRHGCLPATASIRLIPMRREAVAAE